LLLVSWRQLPSDRQFLQSVSEFQLTVFQLFIQDGVESLVLGNGERVLPIPNNAFKDIIK
jgi:hypothetical protein